MKNITYTIIKYLFVFLFVLALFRSIHAQQTINLTVSPPRQELSIKPGEQTRIQIKFINKSDEALNGFIKTADFLVLDKDGSPTLFDSSTSNNRFSASSWITPSEDRVTIAPNDQYLATAYIKVPKDAYPCGHYASVYFEPAPSNLGGKGIRVESASSVAFRLSSLLYFNVEGQCKENAHVSKLQAPKFLEFGPVPVEVDILNRSDYHISPQVALSLANVLEKQTDVKALPLQNIFPDGIRNYKTELGSKWMIGRYKIALNGGYGKTGRSLSAMTYVWVFPWRVTVLILLTCIVFYLLLRTIIQRTNTKTSLLEKEVMEEKVEIEKLKEALKKRSD